MPLLQHGTASDPASIWMECLSNLKIVPFGYFSRLIRPIIRCISSTANIRGNHVPQTACSIAHRNLSTHTQNVFMTGHVRVSTYFSFIGSCWDCLRLIIRLKSQLGAIAAVRATDVTSTNKSSTIPLIRRWKRDPWVFSSSSFFFLSAQSKRFLPPSLLASRLSLVPKPQHDYSWHDYFGYVWPSAFLTQLFFAESLIHNEHRFDSRAIKLKFFQG